MAQTRYVAKARFDAAGPLVASGPPLRWGVVSTGKIAHTVTAQLAQLEDAVLGAVSSRHLGTAQEFARKFGFQTAYGGSTGYQQLADDPAVDVVYVATPHAQHHQVARALLLAGKHVLVEKPFTLNAAQAADLLQLAREQGVFLMEAVWTRFLPAFQRALDVLEEGRVGAVQYVQADLGFVADSDPRTRLWAPEAGGGALLDLAVYPLTWVVAALGFPAPGSGAIRASGRLNAYGVDELCALSLSYPAGQQAQVMVSFVSDASRRASIVGVDGVLRTDAPLTRPEGLTVQVGNVTRRERFPHDFPPYAYQLREVTRCVQQGLLESPTMPLADTLSMMRLQDEARRQLGLIYPSEQ